MILYIFVLCILILLYLAWFLELSFKLKMYLWRVDNEKRERLKKQDEEYMQQFIKKMGGDSFIKQCMKDNESLIVQAIVENRKPYEDTI